MLVFKFSGGEMDAASGRNCHKTGTPTLSSGGGGQIMSSSGCNSGVNHQNETVRDQIGFRFRFIPFAGFDLIETLTVLEAWEHQTDNKKTPQ